MRGKSSPELLHGNRDLLAASPECEEHPCGGRAGFRRSLHPRPPALLAAQSRLKKVSLRSKSRALVRRGVLQTDLSPPREGETPSPIPARLRPSLDEAAASLSVSSRLHLRGAFCIQLFGRWLAHDAAERSASARVPSE